MYLADAGRRHRLATPLLLERLGDAGLPLEHLGFDQVLPESDLLLRVSHVPSLSIGDWRTCSIDEDLSRIGLSMTIIASSTRTSLPRKLRAPRVDHCDDAFEEESSSVSSEVIDAESGKSSRSAPRGSVNPSGLWVDSTCVTVDRAFMPSSRSDWAIFASESVLRCPMLDSVETRPMGGKVSRSMRTSSSKGWLAGVHWVHNISADDGG
ncbi:hypothetical protein BV25DRAFT_1030195 [Artomyces pyxidatus]|uniref:Uncharacterized protein n=1 Tax=Artomyces pyxidatus TaxID=48021 RepID=A0ACB8SUL3_9AGAM|nr:hypothetical protein BV25DRAFT_1030195 [Artomyces pyxidatus]